METTESKPTFKKKLIAEDFKQIKDLQTFVETYAEQLQAVFNEGKRHGITFTPAKLKEQLKTPEIEFGKELSATELKTDKFLTMAKGTYQSLRLAIPYLIISDQVKVNQAELEKFFTANFRFYITTSEEQQDFDNTIQFGKLLLSVQRFVAKNKYSLLAISNVDPAIMQQLSNFKK